MINRKCVVGAGQCRDRHQFSSRWRASGLAGLFGGLLAFVCCLPAAALRPDAAQNAVRIGQRSAAPVRQPAAEQQRLAAVAQASGVSLTWNERLGTPSVVRGADLSAPARYSAGRGITRRAAAGPVERAVAVLDNLAGIYGIRDAAAEFTSGRVSADRMGFTHVRLEQKYKSLKVVGAGLIVHFNADGRAYEVNGRYLADINLNTRPALDAAAAVAAARQDLAAASQAAVKPVGDPELVVFAWNCAPRLAYEMLLAGPVSGGLPARWRCWVDAQSGAVILRYNDIKTAEVQPPSGNGADYPMTGVILAGEGGTTNMVPGWRESNGIHYLYNKTNTWFIYNIALSRYPDALTYAHRMTNKWADSDTTEMSAANNFNTTLKYYRKVHGRNSYDDLGAAARVNVHYDLYYVNAFWNSVDFTFGDGDDIMASSLAVLDVAAHEFTHGVTEYTANLYYFEESGALNESFSDIFGTCAEFYGQPLNTNEYPNVTPGTAEWLCGEDCWRVTPALRDLRNPHNSRTVGSDGRQPSYYYGEFWYSGMDDNGGVHINSGVQNFFFYLISDGGSGRNEDYDYNITGIGWSNAQLVAYRALTEYMYPFTDYAEAREAWISAAADLDPAWAKLMAEAWTAVGVGDLGAQLMLDRPAYRSDATVEFEITDPLNTNLTTSVDVMTFAVTPWVTNIPAARASAAEPFTGSFSLLGHVVEDDILVVTYAGPGGTDEAYAWIDDTPPVLTNFTATVVGDDFCDVYWLSDEPADSSVIVHPNLIPPGGLATVAPWALGGYTYDWTNIDGNVWFVHRLSLEGLSAATKYYAAAVSHDYAGNTSSIPADLTSTVANDYYSFVTLFRGISYANDMEFRDAAWTYTNLHGEACWQFGVPTYGPPSAHSGSNCWGTVLGGRYPNLANAWLVSTPMYVNWRPILTFWSWHRLVEDGDFAQIEVNAGAGWENVTAYSDAFSGETKITGELAEWTPVTVDLSRYTNKTISIRFRIETGVTGADAGWYIDDVRLTDIRPAGFVVADYTVVNDSDGDGYPEPGERFALELRGLNTASARTYSNVVAIVQCPNAGVTLDRGPSPAIVYGDMAPGQYVASGTQLMVTVDAGVPEGTVLTFMHSATAANGGPWQEAFSLQVATHESAWGRVTNIVNGAGISNATVTGEAPNYADVWANTDSNGYFKLNGMMPHVSYSVTAKRSDFSRSEPQFILGQATNIGIGLGRAYANETPWLQVLPNIAQGAQTTLVFRLANTNTDASLPYNYTVSTAMVYYTDGLGLYLWEATDWLTYEPSGSVPVGAATNFSVALDTTTLDRYTYLVLLELQGNDVYQDPVLLAILLNVLPAPAVVIQQVAVIPGPGHDGDPYPEPGETVGLGIQLGNLGRHTAVTPNGILSYIGADPVTVPSNAVAWPDIPLMLTAWSITNPAVAIGAAVSNGAVMPFGLRVTDPGGHVFDLDFALTVTVRRAISGQITTCIGGAPVPGAIVQALQGPIVQEAQSGALGEYALYGLADGEYQVRVIPPSPYAAPPISNIVIAAADASNVNFCVDNWLVSVVPTSIVVNVEEGREFTTNLLVLNSGPAAGSVGFDLQLVEGVASGNVGTVIVPFLDWDALRPGVDYLPGKLLVRFRDGAAPAARALAMQAAGVAVERSFSLIPAAVVTVPQGRSLRAAATDLLANPNVLYVEPNYIMRLHRAPNDPRYPEMWALRNERQTGGTLGAEIGAQAAWDITVGSTGVVVAVIDTGIETGHVDLAANALPGMEFVSTNWQPNARHDYECEWIASGYCIEESIAHGSHVAGTIGAVANNTNGVAGVNWNVRILPLKISTNMSGAYLNGQCSCLGSAGLCRYPGLPAAAELAAVEYAITNNVKISNHSYGGPIFSGVQYEMFKTAMASGMLMVCSAGNSGTDNDLYPQYPASYNLANIVSVAAADHNDQLGSFSCYGAASVDLAAPGVSILSTLPMDCGGYSGYAVWSGTSMAAPHVAGVAALLKSIAPWATWDMLKTAIMEGARPNAALQGKCLAAANLDAVGAIAKMRPAWIRLGTNLASIAGGARFTNAVLLNAGGNLGAGTYRATIVVNQGVNALRIPITLNVAPAPLPVVAAVTVSGGDQDGYAEPGETVQLAIRLKNANASILYNPTGVLATSAGNVTINDGISVWPALASGESAAPLDLMTVTFGNPVTNWVPFTLTVKDQTHAPWTLTFHLAVQTVYSIAGTVRDQQTAAGLAGVPVEYWGERSGRTNTDASGNYRLNGLTNGAYRVRAIGTLNEKSAVATSVLNNADAILDFSLRRPAVAFKPTVDAAAQYGMTAVRSLVLTNTAASTFSFEAIELEIRKVAVISDQAQLAGVAAILADMGFEVSDWRSNLVYVLDEMTYDYYPSGYYTTNDALIFAQDLVVLDLSGPNNGGRLMSDPEWAVLNQYLARGGKLVITGGNPISRPDDRNVANLVGAVSLDRATQAVDTAVISRNMPWPLFVNVAATDRIAVAAQVYDLATPDTNQDIRVFMTAGAAVKVMRRETPAGGVAYYWAGNVNGAEWLRRGVMQDLFKNCMMAELQADAPWLAVAPLNGSIGAATLTETLTLDSTVVDYAATNQAVVMFKGNYPGADNRFTLVRFELVQPSLRASSATGVVDWLGRPIPGNGSATSAIFQLIYAGPNGVIDPPQADGKPGGDDALLSSLRNGLSFGRFGVGYESTPDLGKFDEVFNHALAPSAPARAVYVRGWNGPTFQDAVVYGESGLYTITNAPYEAHDFGRWTLGTVFGFPQNRKDSNGDSIPDGYNVMYGGDPQQGLGPLATAWTNLLTIGAFGTGEGQLNYPARVFLSDKYVFVLDSKNNRVQVFWDRPTNQLVAKFGTSGSGNGQFSIPYGMARSPIADKFAVADSGNHRIQVFTFNPATGAITFERAFGSFGAGNGQFKNPKGVAIDPLGRYVVADTDNSRIQIFNSTGGWVSAFGSLGSLNGQLNKPWGVACDSNGVIYVADTENDRIQIFNGSGVYMYKLGVAGTNLAQFQKPYGVQIGIGGRIYVADTSNSRIQVFDKERNFIGAFGILGSLPGQVRFPYDLMPVATSSVMFVADTWNHRIQKFDTKLDADGDGMDDTWELRHGLDPTVNDALVDSDHDGTFNIGEYRVQADPWNTDTDGDGWSDGHEINNGMLPTNWQYEILRVTKLVPGSGLRMAIMVTTNQSYRIEYTTNLLRAVNWTVLPGSTFTSGTNGMVTNTVPIVPDVKRMYRPVKQ